MSGGCNPFLKDLDGRGILRFIFEKFRWKGGFCDSFLKDLEGRKEGRILQVIFGDFRCKGGFYKSILKDLDDGGIFRDPFQKNLDGGRNCGKIYVES